MPIIAPIHSWQYRRLLVLFVALVVAGLWFAYDGWLGWPGSDNALVWHMEHSRYVTAHEQTTLERWPGWYGATPGQRLQMDRLVETANFSGWHSSTDIQNQRWIVAALAVLAAGALIWFLTERRRSIVADDSYLRISQRRRIALPDIVRIDNRRWNRDGIVVISYRQGTTLRHVKLDGMAFDNLSELLDVVAAHASQAEITPLRKFT